LDSGLTALHTQEQKQVFTTSIDEHLYRLQNRRN